MFPLQRCRSPRISGMKSIVRIMRVLLPLALAAVLSGVIWLRFGNGSARSPTPLDPAFVRLTPLEMATLPLATRFDMPMGSEHGALTYNARAFRVERHLGDDLNGIGGGNSDLGDAVYAAGAGRVVYAGSPGPGWGKMILIAHRLPDSGANDVCASGYDPSPGRAEGAARRQDWHGGNGGRHLLGTSAF